MDETETNKADLGSDKELEASARASTPSPRQASKESSEYHPGRVPPSDAHTSFSILWLHSCHRLIMPIRTLVVGEYGNVPENVVKLAG